MHAPALAEDHHRHLAQHLPDRAAVREVSGGHQFVPARLDQVRYRLGMVRAAGQAEGDVAPQQAARADGGQPGET
jgi:hypothetical protein